MAKTRPLPIRTCVACRQTDEKRDLLRVVRQTDGTTVYDVKGKLSGRGAYVCAITDCIQNAKKRRQLERSLKVITISEEVFQTLLGRATETTIEMTNGLTPIMISGTEPENIEKSSMSETGQE